MTKHKSDSKRYYGDMSLKSRIKCILFQPGYRYTKILRITKYLKGKSILIYVFFRWKLLRMSYKYGYQINPNADIGYGLYIGHRGMLIVNENAIIGNNVNIQSGVTIGAENRGVRKGAPLIGDRVWIGANAVVVGKIRIGNNVLIAPNAYVNFNVPDNSIVVGNPAKSIKNNNATEGYIVYTYEDY